MNDDHLLNFFQLRLLEVDHLEADGGDDQDKYRTMTTSKSRKQKTRMVNLKDVFLWFGDEMLLDFTNLFHFYK